jgi:hypothetical protein
MLRETLRVIVSEGRTSVSQAAEEPQPMCRVPARLSKTLTLDGLISKRYLGSARTHSHTSCSPIEIQHPLEIFSFATTSVEDL